jgi:hypothetical protein
MPRPKSPEGKSVTFSVKLSEQDAKAADAIAAESGWSRSAWLQHLISVAIAGKRDSQAASAAMRHSKATPCTHRLPAGAYCKTCARTKT